MVSDDPRACVRELRKAKAALEHWGADADSNLEPGAWSLTEALKRKQEHQASHQQQQHSKRQKDECYDTHTAGGTLLCLYDGHPRKEYQARAKHEHATNNINRGQ